jgi:ribonuclease P protein component
MPRTTRPIATLKNRAEFQRVRGGGRASAPSFVLEGRKRTSEVVRADSSPTLASQPRFGFTITKKVGNAVTRNKMRRRLRGALGEIVGACADPEMDYVVVARSPAAVQDYENLKADLRRAFQQVHRPRLSQPARVSQRPQSSQKP